MSLSPDLQVPVHHLGNPVTGERGAVTDRRDEARDRVREVYRRQPFSVLGGVAGALWDPDPSGEDPATASVDRFTFPDGRHFLLREHLPELPLRSWR